MSKKGKTLLATENQNTTGIIDGLWDWAQTPAIEGRSWPDDKARAVLSINDSSEGVFGRAVLTWARALQFGSNDEVQSAVKALISLAGSSKQSVVVSEVLWLSSFCATPSIYTPFFDSLATDALGQWDKRYGALGLARLGRKKEALALLDDSGDDVEKELVQAITAGVLPTTGAGLYFPYTELGSFHHIAPAHPHEVKLFTAILRELRKGQQPQSALWLESAIQHFFIREQAEALLLLEELIAISANDADALALKALISFEQGRVLEAVQIAKQAITVQNSQPLAHTLLARFYLTIESHSLAYKHLEIALDVAPEYPEAINLMGRLLAKQDGQKDRAYDLLKKSIQLESDNPDYHLYLCIGLLSMGDLEKLHSEWSYHKAHIQAFTDKDSVRRLISTVLMGAKEPMQEVAVAEMLQGSGFTKAATVFLQRAWRRAYTVAKNKQNEFIYHTGVQANRIGELSIALEAFTQLDKIEGPLGTAPIFIAMTLGKMGKYTEALEALERFRDRDFNYFALKADMHYGLGQASESILALQSALEKQPNSMLAMHKALLIAGYMGQADVFNTLKSKTKVPAGHEQLSQYIEWLPTLFFGSEEDKDKLLKDGLAALKAGKYESEITEALVEMEPALVGISLCEVAFSLDDLELLQEIITCLQSRQPNYDYLWNLYEAEARRQGGHYEEALKRLGSFVTGMQAELSQALCLWDLKRYDEAEKILSTLAQSNDFARPFLHPQGCPRRIIMQVYGKTLQKLGKNDDGQIWLERAKGLQKPA